MKKIIIALCICILVIITLVLGINCYVKMSTKNYIKDNSNIDSTGDIDCILILGAGIWDNKPSPMLEDRLLEGINLYQKGLSSKILMSGDHSRADYNEVNVMKEFAVNKGVPSEDIFLDHAGLSTYDSMYRAKAIFGVKKCIIVTQQYHLYRALYIAKKLGIEAIGMPADPRVYAGATFRELREILARDKDFVKCIFKPEPTFLGESIPISGNADLTEGNDDEESR